MLRAGAGHAPWAAPAGVASSFAREVAARTRAADVRLLVLLALSGLLLHVLTNGQYGFHRDELVTLDDARQLAWS